ncbi:hypothetical protein E2P81_ATG01073 [Venturia nashicola]|uniref:Cytochrome c oxidase assembly protein n=1 Tax=Venturia nashicola TaxID=86259 RepID=A0A4Z1PB27_9PEZI|nr:hypothetical protein E6O75_ATG01095 [Venturia nashicola]TLD38530.1 hypothetical protein E2P81_ATG01073 [Venturia nashicola]
MSAASKATLAATSLSAIGIIIFVHYGQKVEKAGMHAGVLRDMEQQRIRRERQLDFDMQKTLEEEYKKLQTVENTTNQADSTPPK